MMVVLALRQELSFLQRGEVRFREKLDYICVFFEFHIMCDE